MNKKILVVVETIDVDNSSGAKGRVAFINSFFKAGYDVTVLHFSQKEILIEGVKCVSIPEHSLSLFFILGRLQRLLYRWFKIDINNFVNAVFGFSFGFFSDVNSILKAVKNYKAEDYGMIWTFGNGTSFRSHAALLRKPEWYSKWYAFVHDPYPQDLYPRPFNFVEYGFKKKRNFFRDITIHAQRVVFPSLLLKEWMQSYFVDLEGKSLIIPHPLQDEPQGMPGKITLPFKLSKFNIIHAGNLLNLRDPKSLVLAYEAFLNRIPAALEDSNLFIVGKESIFHKFLKEKQFRISQIIVSEGYLSFQESYYMQLNASVNVILEAKSEISPFLPGKFPHCVKADRPILLIGPYYSETKRLLGKNYPYLFGFDDVVGISKAIEELYFKWKKDSNLKLDRADLVYYLSHDYLKEIIEDKSGKYLV